METGNALHQYAITPTTMLNFTDKLAGEIVNTNGDIKIIYFRGQGRPRSNFITTPQSRLRSRDSPSTYAKLMLRLFGL